MIRITFVEPATRIWQRWRKDCEKSVPSVSDALTTRTKPAISDLYKRKSIKDAVYFATGGPFRGKCAYCETYITHSQNPDIEHYRPKLGVTDEHDRPVDADYGWGATPHWGYFWLAYDWRNLLPVCQKCNQASSISGEKIGKHNRFPVAGAHAAVPGELAGEQPLLLNPLVDDPAEHIAISLKDGVLTARSGSTRGEKTIQILGLNVRDQIREKRQATIDEVRALLVKVLFSPDDRKATLERLKAMKEGRTEYTIAVRACLKDAAQHVKVITDD